MAAAPDQSAAFLSFLVDFARLAHPAYPNALQRVQRAPCVAKLAQPCRDESALVGARRGELVMLREVNLYCGETPVVFAHSVLGRRSLREAWCSISRQGVKPLGAALFANPLVKRTPLYFKKLTAHHELYHRACRLLKTPPNHLWARRSVFILRDRPVMVTEIFLPGILELSR
ncbi:MAG TPA: chorismate lyase [Burkholderiales bacterium]|nr:chorismate lyase [Burkholderiales bacterium]